MKQMVITLLVALFSLSGMTQTQPKRPAPTLAFTHVTVLDMNGGPSKPDMTVIISGNRITSVQNSRKFKQPKGAKVVDATGKFLMPGLWDMHVHALRQQGYNTDNFFPLFIANGITGVREMGNSPLAMAEVQRLRKKIEKGELAGPRFFMCGPLINGNSSGWKSTVVVTTEQQGRAVVDSLKTAGVDFIKVYSGLSPDVYLAIANAAKNQGISFAGHVPGLVKAEEASNAGQKSFEHLNELLLACSSREEHLRQERSAIIRTLQPGSLEWRNRWNLYNQKLLNTYNEEKAKELFSLLIKNNTWQCPTLTERYASSHFIESSQAHPDWLKYISTSWKDFWAERTASRKKNNTPASMELLKEQYQKELQLVAAMNKAGVPLLAGSDDGNPYVFPGFSLHDELGLLVEAGLSPLEALQAATINPAKYFGLIDSLGTVEKGKLTDLLLLEANPLEKIGHTKKIAAVVANGRYFSKEAMAQLLKDAETAAGQK